MKFKDSEGKVVDQSSIDGTHTIKALHLVAFLQDPATVIDENDQILFLTSWSIVAEFETSGCLEINALLPQSKVPTFIIKAHTGSAASLMKHLTDIKKIDLSTIGGLKVDHLLDILKSGTHYTGLAASVPHTNVSKLEILKETLKALKLDGKVADDGESTFFTPIKSTLVLKQRATNLPQNYFSPKHAASA